MSDRLWQRLGAASGIFSVVLGIVGKSIQGRPSEAPKTAEAIARALAEAAGAGAIGAVGRLLEVPR